MRFVAFVVTEGAMPAEAIAEMNRDWPAYAEQIRQRGGLRLGRELDLPEAGVATVRVRDGETLITDGPFAETKEFIAGIEVLESTDLDEVIAIESRNPVARFNPFELRPLPDAFRLGSKVTAFADGDDADGIPYLLMVWTDASPDSAAEAAQLQAADDWRAQQERAGAFILGGPIGGPHTATTLRASNGAIHAGEGPFRETAASITEIEVVRATDLRSAVTLAAGHPQASRHAIEVRSFYSDASPADRAG